MVAVCTSVVHIMSKIVLAVVVALFALTAVAQSTLVAQLTGPVGASSSTKYTYTGLLADRLCVDLVTAVDGTDMLHTPSGHSSGCAFTIPACIASGYCLMAKNSITNLWGCTYNFTQADGSAIRTQLLAQDSTPGRTNLIISFTATWASAGATTMTVDTASVAFGSSPLSSGAIGTAGVVLAAVAATLLTMAF